MALDFLRAYNYSCQTCTLSPAKNHVSLFINNERCVYHTHTYEKIHNWNNYNEYMLGDESAMAYLPHKRKNQAKNKNRRKKRKEEKSSVQFINLQLICERNHIEKHSSVTIIRYVILEPLTHPGFILFLFRISFFTFSVNTRFFLIFRLKHIPLWQWFPACGRDPQGSAKNCEGGAKDSQGCCRYFINQKNH